MRSRRPPERFGKIAGPLPPAGSLEPARPHPFSTVAPAREGYVDNHGVRVWFAVWGEHGPWIAFAQPFQIVHSAILKAVVPYLSRHFRVVTMDGRGNGRSSRPVGQQAYSFDHYYDDFVAVLDAAGADRVALVGISAAAMIVLRLAATQPERVTHLITAGGFADARVPNPAVAERLQADSRQMREDWPAFVDSFMATIFSEPHSTKPYEDGVRYGWASSGEVIDWCSNGWQGHEVLDCARRVTCPTLVIHGDADRRVPYACGELIHELVPGSRMLTIGGGGHVPAIRDPVLFNRAVRDFVGAPVRSRTWVRAMARRRRALFISSPIGLGHAQRDVAIARELRKLQPDLDIDWMVKLMPTVIAAVQEVVESKIDTFKSTGKARP